jgi:CRISPR system Cascade subunit CasB
MTEAQPRRLGSIARSWWRDLQPRPDGSGGDRAALARLRRAATARDAAEDPTTLALCRALGMGWRGLEGAAVAAAVLARVREDAPDQPAARQLGGAEPVMSWLRFRRLIQAETPDERITAMRRAVALAGGRLNVADLGGSLLAWNDERRRRWLYAYHDAPDPAAAPPEEPTA